MNWMTTMNSWPMAEDFQTELWGENWWNSLIDGTITESDSVSDASIVSHETPKAQNSDSSSGNDSIFINSAFQMMGTSFSSSPTSDWNQNSLKNNIGDVENNFDCLLEEEMDTKLINCHEEQATAGKDCSIMSFKTCVVEELSLDKYGYPSTIVEALFNDDFSINCSSTANYEITPSLLKQKFSDNIFSGAELYQSMEDKKKGESIEPVLKRQRIEAPSPLPTFKVRKEKMGDRITALQQLVSPFGKTDTASVLHEAVEYIRFLHDQISALSAPYMKLKKEGMKQDPRGQGLCLVPICSTFAFANEITSDFWIPRNLNYGGNFT